MWPKNWQEDPKPRVIINSQTWVLKQGLVVFLFFIDSLKRDNFLKHTRY